MSVRKRGSSWAVVHCHGAAKGKTIKGGRHRTKAKALAQHPAIQARKSQKDRKD
jgi:hypothetical protein